MVGGGDDGRGERAYDSSSRITVHSNRMAEHHISIADLRIRMEDSTIWKVPRLIS